MDGRIGFENITKLAWNDAVENYLEDFNKFFTWISGTDESAFWANNALDTAAQVVIGSTSAVIAMIPFVGPFLSFGATMVGFSVYQYIVRPFLIDIMSENNLLGMPSQPQSIRADEEKFTFSLFDYSIPLEVSVFKSGITLKDSTPFWDNTPWLEPLEPDVDPDGDGYWDNTAALEICDVNVPGIGNTDYYHAGFTYWLDWFNNGGSVEIFSYIGSKGYSIEDFYAFFESEIFEYIKFLYPDQDSIWPDDVNHRRFTDWDDYTLPQGPDLTDLDYYTPEEIITIKIRAWRFMHYYFNREWDKGIWGLMYDSGHDFLDDVIHYNNYAWYTEDNMNLIFKYNYAEFAYGTGSLQMDNADALDRYMPSFTTEEIDQSIDEVIFKGYGDAFGELSTKYYEKYWRDISPDGENRNEVEYVQGILTENTLIYKDFDIYVQSDGRPVLVPSTENNFNASDPIDRYIDFFKVYYLSKYQGEYEYSYMNSNKIQVRNLIVQAAQVIITMGVTHGIGKLGAKVQSKTMTNLGYNVPPAVGKGLTLLEIGHELVEEMFLENIVSSAATALGFTDDWANILGESFWSFGSVLHGTIDTWKTGNMIVRNIKAVRQNYYKTKLLLVNPKSDGITDKHFGVDYREFSREAAKIERTIRLESKSLSLSQIANEMSNMNVQLLGWRRSTTFANQIQNIIDNKHFILDHIDANRIDPSKFENVVEKLGMFKIKNFKDYHGNEVKFRKILLKYLMIHLHDTVKEFVTDRNMLDELGVPAEKYVYFEGTFGTHEGLVFSEENCPNAIVIDLIQNLQDLTIVDPIKSAFINERLSSLNNDDIYSARANQNEVDSFLRGTTDNPYFGINKVGLELPADITIKGLEKVCYKIGKATGPRQIIRIDPSSPLQKSDLFGSGKLLEGIFLDEYNPSITNPAENALPVDKMYLINYMHPLLLEARLNNELILNTADKGITIMQDEIIYNTATIKTELETNRDKNWENFDRTHDFWRNAIIFQTITEKKIPTFEKIIAQNYDSARDMVESMWEMAKNFEVITPGLGPTILNWLLPTMPNPDSESSGARIVFTEWLKIITNGVSWQNTDLDGVVGSGFQWSMGIQNPANIEAAKALLEWMKINSKVLKDTLLTKGTIRSGLKGLSFKTRNLEKIQTIVNNILAIEGQTFSVKYDIFRGRKNQFSADIGILMDKGTAHFKKFFEIWFEGNQQLSTITDGNIPQMSYGRDISDSESMATSDDIYRHLSLWYYDLCFDYQVRPDNMDNVIYFGGDRAYIVPYKKEVATSEYDLENLLFYRTEHPFISIKIEQNFRHYPIDTEYISGNIKRDIALSRIEFEDTLRILNGKIAGGSDTPIAFMGLPEPLKFVSEESIFNYRLRSEPLDRLSRISRIEGAIANHKRIFSYLSRKMVVDVSPYTGIDAIDNWNKFLETYGDEIITINTNEFGGGKTLTGTISYIDTYLSSGNKPIFYDWLLALKNRGGKITDLVTIERLGGYIKGYIERKDWDAGQYKKDRMPMIYIVQTPSEKLEILQNCKHIGKDFPLLTSMEFNEFMDGLHTAYNDENFDFSLENFIKSLFVEVAGEPNWMRWGMRNTEYRPYAEMIQGSFGINKDGNYIHTDSENPFIWKYRVDGDWVGHTNYNWGDRLQNNYWQFARESLIQSLPDYRRKLYQQFMATKPEWIHIDYDNWNVWYG